MHTIPQTQAVRRLMAEGASQASLADLIFLESWELDPAPELAAVLRVGQIRRAQPGIAAAIRAEVTNSLPERKLS